jgi:hypothetical protein
MRAAAPETTGVAMLVPLRRRYLALESLVQTLNPRALRLHVMSGLVGLRVRLV